METLISDILITSQTLNINNLRATSAKSIGLNIIRKLMEYLLRGRLKTLGTEKGYLFGLLSKLMTRPSFVQFYLAKDVSILL